MCEKWYVVSYDTSEYSGIYARVYCKTKRSVKGILERHWGCKVTINWIEELKD